MTSDMKFTDTLGVISNLEQGRSGKIKRNMKWIRVRQQKKQGSSSDAKNWRRSSSDRGSWSSEVREDEEEQKLKQDRSLSMRSSSTSRRRSSSSSRIRSKMNIFAHKRSKGRTSILRRKRQRKRGKTTTATIVDWVE